MKVLLADDHALFREGLRLALIDSVEGIADVVEAADFNGAMAMLVSDPAIEIGLIDLNMPGMNGVAGLTLLRQQAPDVPLVVVSAHQDAATIADARQAGAAGFIGKGQSVAALIRQIRALFAEDGGDYSPCPGLGLTPRQGDVLAMVRRGLTNKEIGRELGIAEITVKLHVTAILKTLGVRNRTEAALIALNPSA